MSEGGSLLAVVPVRDGTLPQGGAEAVAECGGNAVLAGVGVAAAADELAGVARRLTLVELPGVAPGALAASLALAPVVEEAAVVVLPASPDGRDLAPRLAQELGRPLLAGAVRVHARGAALARWGGLVEEDATADGPFVATLLPGVRGVEVDAGLALATRAEADPALPERSPRDATTLAVLPPDVTTMDLTEARRILGGGAGLESAERFEALEAVATALGASMGATRVVTDKGWVAHERQIGTTGVVVDPRLYLAFGISGAVQHTSGLGTPDHIVSVNLDATCPMMQLADLAIVADANAVLDALADLLGAGAAAPAAAG